MIKPVKYVIVDKKEKQLTELLTKVCKRVVTYCDKPNRSDAEFLRNKFPIFVDYIHSINKNTNLQIDGSLECVVSASTDVLAGLMKLIQADGVDYINSSNNLINKMIQVSHYINRCVVKNNDGSFTAEWLIHEE